MRITSIDLAAFSVRRRYRTQASALGGVPAHAGGGASESWFVILSIHTDEGIVGQGEISDIPPETYPGLSVLRGLLEPRLVGRDPFDLEALTKAFPIDLDVRPDGTVYDILAAGVDGALQDACARRAGMPVSSLNGGACRSEIPVSWVAFIRDDLSELEAEIDWAARFGISAFKLKVGLDSRLDEERIRIVRRIAGDDAHIKIDANSAWTTDDAIANLRRWDPLHISGVETPVAYRDVEGKAKVRQRTGVQVLEHVNDVAFAVELLRGNAVDVFNVSTTGAGGIWRARKVLAVAEGTGTQCLLGSTVELGLGTAAQLHLGASSAVVTWPSDLVGPLLYDDDVIETPLAWRAGSLVVPTGVGVGVRVDSERLRTLVERSSLRASSGTN